MSSASKSYRYPILILCMIAGALLLSSCGGYDLDDSRTSRLESEVSLLTDQLRKATSSNKDLQQRLTREAERAESLSGKLEDTQKQLQCLEAENERLAEKVTELEGAAKSTQRAGFWFRFLAGVGVVALILLGIVVVGITLERPGHRK